MIFENLFNMEGFFMIEKKQIYKCQVCGNIVEVLIAGGGTLVCCGKPMTYLPGNTTDAAVEKHVPVVTKIDGGVKVAVGSVEHPMTDAHYIQFIEVITATKVLRKELTPSDKPEAVFQTDEEVVEAREYCNLHGLWKKA